MLPKNLEEFIAPVISMAESQFPRSCACCGRSFEDFKTYVQRTKLVGGLTDVRTAETDPLAVLSWANCVCGSTLVLSFRPESRRHARFVRILEDEAIATGRSVEHLLLAMREEVRERMGKYP